MQAKQVGKRARQQQKKEDNRQFEQVAKKTKNKIGRKSAYNIIIDLKELRKRRKRKYRNAMRKKCRKMELQTIFWGWLIANCGPNRCSTNNNNKNGAALRKCTVNREDVLQSNQNWNDDVLVDEIVVIDGSAGVAGSELCRNYKCEENIKNELMLTSSTASSYIGSAEIE